MTLRPLRVFGKAIPTSGLELANLGAFIDTGRHGQPHLGEQVGDVLAALATGQCEHERLELGESALGELANGGDAEAVFDAGGPEVILEDTVGHFKTFRPMTR